MRAAFLYLLVALKISPAWRGLPIWDDVDSIVQNPLLRDGQGLFKIWFSRAAIDYWPVTGSLFWLQWQFWQDSTLGYHLVSIVLHATNAVLAWRLLRRLQVRTAYGVAVLFALHPVTVEASAWMVQQKTLLCLTLLLSSALLYLRGGRAAHVMAWLLFVLSLLAKTASLAWPAVLIGYLYTRRAKLREYAYLAPYVLAALAMAGWSFVWYAAKSSPYEVIREDNLLARILTAAWAYWFYLSKVVLPYPLIFVYPRMVLQPDSWLSFVPLACLIFIYRSVKCRPLFWGLGFAALMLVPVLGFYPIYFMRFSLVADHWQYLALIGVLVAWLEPLRERRYLTPLICAIALGFGCLSWQRSHDFVSAEALWQDTLEKNPDAWLADNELGIIRRQQGNLNEATVLYHRSLRVQDNWQAHNGLGVILETRGLPEAAMLEYRKALGLNPVALVSNGNLGFLLAQLGQLPEAEARLRPLYEQDPSAVNCYRLGFVYEKQGRRDLAKSLYQLATERDATQAFYRQQLQRITQ